MHINHVDALLGQSCDFRSVWSGSSPANRTIQRRAQFGCFYHHLNFLRLTRHWISARISTHQCNTIFNLPWKQRVVLTGPVTVQQAGATKKAKKSIASMQIVLPQCELIESSWPLDVTKTHLEFSLPLRLLNHDNRVAFQERCCKVARWGIFRGRLLASQQQVKNQCYAVVNIVDWILSLIKSLRKQYKQRNQWELQRVANC